MTEVAEENSSETAAQLASSIAALPPLPATAQEILTCFGDEFIDASKVTAVVEGDPGICAKLLGLANSAYFGLGEPVNRVDEAISRVLGVDTVRSLVLAMAIQQSFSSRSCPAFDTARFWMKSVMTAECCKKIARHSAGSLGDAKDLAYSAGLCHNLGLMVLAHSEPERTNRALSKVNGTAQSSQLAYLLDAEFGTNHRAVTAEISRTWSLPEPMVQAYQYRAFRSTECEHFLGVVVAASADAVENAQRDDEDMSDLTHWASQLDMTSDDLQELAMLNDKQTDRVRSLVLNLSRS